MGLGLYAKKCVLLNRPSAGEVYTWETLVLTLGVATFMREK